MVSTNFVKTVQKILEKLLNKANELINELKSNKEVDKKIREYKGQHTFGNLEITHKIFDLENSLMMVLRIIQEIDDIVQGLIWGEETTFAEEELKELVGEERGDPYIPTGGLRLTLHYFKGIREEKDDYRELFIEEIKRLIETVESNLKHRQEQKAKKNNS